MPILPAPSSFLVSGGDTPIVTTDDVLAEYPLRVRQEPVAPVRDAAVELQTEIFLFYQDVSAYAAAQSDPTRATGVYLEEFTGEVDVFRQAGEDDEDLRDRYFSPPAIVTPDNVRDAVDALLAPVTDKRCILWESILDQVYVDDGDAVWSIHLGDDGLADMSPEYPDRRYALRGACSPGDAFTFDNDADGRYFIVLLPELEQISGIDAFVVEPTDPLDTFGFYADDGAGVAIDAAVFDGGATAEAVYAAIVNQVEVIRGHGVRWMALVDPKI
jgi:hypothetical protein